MWVVEASEPVGHWPVSAGHPVVELVVSIDQTLDPSTERWCVPRDFDIGCIDLPSAWNSEIKDHTD